MLLKLSIHFYLVQQQWFDFNLIYASWKTSRPMVELSVSINRHSIHFILTLKSRTADARKLVLLLLCVVNKSKQNGNIAMKCTENSLNSVHCNDKFQLSIDSSSAITFTWIFHVFRVEWDRVLKGAERKLFTTFYWDVANTNNRDENKWFEFFIDSMVWVGNGWLHRVW